PGAHRLAGAAGGGAHPAEHRADPRVVRRLPDHTTSRTAHAPLTLKKQAPASRAGGGPPGGCAATEPTTSVVSDSGRTASGSRWGLRRRRGCSSWETRAPACRGTLLAAAETLCEAAGSALFLRCAPRRWGAPLAAARTARADGPLRRSTLGDALPTQRRGSEGSPRRARSLSPSAPCAGTWSPEPSDTRGGTWRCCCCEARVIASRTD